MYPDPNGQVSFTVRTTTTYGVLVVDEIHGSP
jgi:hypothetical protein